MKKTTEMQWLVLYFSIQSKIYPQALFYKNCIKSDSHKNPGLGSWGGYHRNAATHAPLCNTLFSNKLSDILCPKVVKILAVKGLKYFQSLHTNFKSPDSYKKYSYKKKDKKGVSHLILTGDLNTSFFYSS